MRWTVTLLAGIALAAGAGRPPAAQGPSAWQTATPESQGLSSAKLEAIKDDLAARNTLSLLIVRNDRIVYEWYADGRTPQTKHYTASMSKAIVGGVALALAMSDGLVALDDPVAKYVPAWRDDPGKSRITIRQLGSHTSGIEDAEQDGLPHNELPGWKGDFWKRRDPPRDPFTLARDAAALLFEPGQGHQYSNPGIAMLTYAITAALTDAPIRDVRTLLRERVMRPVGVADADWNLGYNSTVIVDGLPLVAAWGGANYTPRAVASVARLMAHGGEWEGRRLLSEQAGRLVTTDAGTPGSAGIGWWSNHGGENPKLPRDAFWGAGAGHQIVLVVPSLKLIAVRNGGVIAPTAPVPAAFHVPVWRHLVDPLLDARLDVPMPGTAAPYAASAVIDRIDWAPASEIVRRAEGSDTWPLTWADDDALYGAYADGWGFEPRVERKLSLGFARIAGDAGSFRGENIRASTLERLGDGAAGPKPSGLLAVDGRFYLWVRNTANSQLAWSDDRGRTWRWADWRFTESFGAPTFLNFGRDYAGARDEFVYIYSPDADNAYDSADRMVLARVPAARVADRAAYEFFGGVDAAGRWMWTKDLAARGAVFTHTGRTYRSGISYNAGLRRYLWCQVLPESTDTRGPRYQGGFGVYDAPEPWGPWTSAFFTEAWDVGPGETCSFPTKWMSADGTTVHLAFSGDDAFSVRRARLVLADTASPR